MNDWEGFGLPFLFIMGFLQSNICYETIYGAYMDYAMSIPTPPPSSVSFTKKTYNPSSVYGSLTGHYQFDNFVVLPSGSLVYSSTFSIAEPVFPVCDPLKPFTDGAFFGATVAGAFITVSLIAVLRRAL